MTSGLAAERDTKPEDSTKFGVFGGVFVPNVLTILGVIMFLRTGWVVGQAGLRDALIILLIANAITFLTSLSLSAIATNLKVKAGGAYFLISRNLGLEIGGSIGVPLFLAQAVSVAFYIIGFVESLEFLFPEIPARLVSMGTLAVLFVIAWVGAELAIKTQYVILAALALSLASFFAGWMPVPDWTASFEPGYAPDVDFWLVFAIFFPAVTGIMSGVSMSGDLKEPSKAIPRGTLMAVGVTFVIYAAQMVWLSLNASRADLVHNSLVMQQIAVFPPLIFVGLWAATLSSALASLLSAPRTLQALALDRVLPRILGRGTGPANEPKLALILSTVLAGVCLLAGKLDLIAPVISMFFLATYGTLNLVSGMSALVSSPSYRPTFRVHWLPSLVGGFGCVFAMFLLSPLATIGSAVVIFGLYSFLKRRRYQTAWGDERSGIWFALARLGLLQLSASREHVRNWRPVLLVLVGNPKSRMHLVELATRLEASRGMIFLAQVIAGDWKKLVARQEALQESLREFIRETRLAAVGKTVLADNFEHGVSTLLQVSGIGPLQPNTVLIGWSEDQLKRASFIQTVRRILELKRSLLVYAEAELPESQLEPVIDVWWRARINGGFMLTLAHLLRESGGAGLRDHRIRVRRIVESEHAVDEAREALEKLVRETRFDAEVEILPSSESALATIAVASARSSHCFVGLGFNESEAKDDPLADYAPVVDSLKGHILLCRSWHDLHPEEDQDQPAR